jgi:putative hydrolase of the HAD superfamily
MEKYMQPFPGAIEAVKSFRANGVRLALVTNGSSEFQRRKIARFGLEPLFDHMVIEGEFGCGKPDGRVFRHTLEALRVDAADAWMIGDDLNRDVDGAQQAGIFAIWLDWEGHGLPASSAVRPDRIINSVAGLA